MNKFLFIAALLITFAAATPTETNLSRSSIALGAISIASAIESSWLSDWLSKHCSNCRGWL